MQDVLCSSDSSCSFKQTGGYMANEEVLESKKETNQVGQIVSSVKVVKVFRAEVKFKFGVYFFYFLNGEAVTVFLSLINNKAIVDEVSLNKKGKKYFSSEGEDIFAKEASVDESDGNGVRSSFENLDKKLRELTDRLNPLEVGFLEAVTLRVLKDCHE